MNPSDNLHPIFQNGDPLQKYRDEGTHRACSPQETLNRVTPLLPKLGITRIANVTGLDRLGVPVTVVTRPQSRSLAVSQGKGVNLLAAQVSGVMESIETWHAERVQHALSLASFNELSCQGPVVDVHRLARSRLRSWNPDTRLLWVRAEALHSGPTCWIPYECVHTDYTLPRPSGSGFFAANTNGLASGNHLLEALAHALFEVIERDALTLWRLRQDPHPVTLNLESVNHPACASLISRIQEAGFDVRVWPVTSDVGVPCFEALLMARDADDTDPEFGSGCHPDAGIALLRALTEAVQGRTTFITGSRDDFGHQPYSPGARTDRQRFCHALMQAPGETAHWQALRGYLFDTILEDVQFAAEQLGAIGCKQILWVDLSQTGIDVPVVRVVVPGLEGPYKGPDSDYVAGYRAESAINRPERS